MFQGRSVARYILHAYYAVSYVNFLRTACYTLVPIGYYIVFLKRRNSCVSSPCDVCDYYRNIMILCKHGIKGIMLHTYAASYHNALRPPLNKCEEQVDVYYNIQYT